MKKENRIKVFISYTRSSNAFAEELKEELSRQNFVIWKDTARIQGGQDWRNAIDVAIGKSDALIVLITSETMKSHYVTYEWAYALGLNKKVIPVLFEEVSVHPRLDVLQHIKFYTAEKEYEQLIKALKSQKKKKKVAKRIENTVIVNNQDLKKIKN